eukprot:maker-scaffold130_size324016-snap-gene-0.16 protein:Tk07091 transcript:maker-scaffold130_size324016-snap-gene-0.16-mRNA-1 annotation:"haloacid dehalogenase superfamily subfamily ia variant 3 with third motif having dd or ed"
MLCASRQLIPSHLCVCNDEYKLFIIPHRPVLILLSSAFSIGSCRLKFCEEKPMANAKVSTKNPRDTEGVIDILIDALSFLLPMIIGEAIYIVGESLSNTIRTVQTVFGAVSVSLLIFLGLDPIRCFVSFYSWLVFRILGLPRSDQEENDYLNQAPGPVGEALAMNYWSSFLRTLTLAKPRFKAVDKVEIYLVLPETCVFHEMCLKEFGFDEMLDQSVKLRPENRAFHQRSTIEKKIYKYVSKISEIHYLIVDFPSLLRSGMKNDRIQKRHRKRNLRSFKKYLVSLMENQRKSSQESPICAHIVEGEDEESTVRNLVKHLETSSELRAVISSSEDSDGL